MNRAVSQRHLGRAVIGAGAFFALGFAFSAPALAQGGPAEPAPPAAPSAAQTAPTPSAPAEAAPPQTAPPQGPPANAYPPPPPRYPSQTPPTNDPSAGYGVPPASYPGAAPAYQAAPTYWGPRTSMAGRPWGYEPATEGIYRPFTFTVGVGPGGLVGPGEHQQALSYLFRVGFGLARNLTFVMSFEGTGTNSVNPGTGADSWLQQENWLLGIQYHILQRLYVRGSVGAGHVSEHIDDDAVLSGGTGVAMSGGIGFEFIQTPRVSLALELNGSATRYSRETWGTTGLNLAVSFY